MGSEIRPIEITAAAITPVVAARSAPTKIVARASPPRSGPNICPTVSSRSSAIPLRSRMIPMKVKKGTARSVSFCMMPNTRSGRAWNSVGGNSPISMPISPKVSPVAARLKATGKPVSRNTSRPANSSGTKLWVMNSISTPPDYPQTALRRGFRQERGRADRGSCRAERRCA